MNLAREIINGIIMVAIMLSVIAFFSTLILAALLSPLGVLW